MFHTQVEELINEFDELTPNYQLVVTRKGNMDKVEVKVEVSQIYSTAQELDKSLTKDFVSSNESLLALTNKLARKIKNNIGITMEVSLQSLEAIPRSSGGKLNRILDLRNKTN